jgi:RNA polymerase sigma factor (sigma-70 family)
MSDAPSFTELLRRARDGDEEAIQALVTQHAHVIRIAARRGLSHNPHLNAAFDASDICQTVLKSLFHRLAAGEFDLNSPEDLEALLAQMAANKFQNHLRRETAARRDVRRVTNELGALVQATDGPPPDRVVESRELLERVLTLLNLDERTMAQMRIENRSWPEIAAVMGGTPAARRVQLAKAVALARQHLRLDQESTDG